MVLYINWGAVSLVVVSVGGVIRAVVIGVVVDSCNGSTHTIEERVC